MDMSSRVKPFSFERVFSEQPKGRSRDVTALLLEIEHLELEVLRLRRELETGLNVVRAEAFQGGLDHARNDREEAILSAADALQGSLESLEQRFEKIEEKVTLEGAHVAVAAGEFIAARSLSLDPCSAINEAIGRTLQQVRRGEAILIRVNPEIVCDIEALVAERQSKDRRQLNLSVVGDATIPLGDAELAWESGELTLSSEARRAAVARELKCLFPNA